MGNFSSYKIKPIIIPLCFLLSIACLVITIPIHETTHWILSDLDPTTTPTEMHLFNIESIFSENIFQSALGYVIISEEYPGSFEQRLPESDLIQEIICTLLQLIITILCVYKITIKLIKRYPDFLVTND